MAVRVTVADLAAESGLEIDDVLITLWEGGIEDPTSPDDVISQRVVNVAKGLLGISRPSTLTRPEFWAETFGLSEDQLRDLLDDLGIGMSPNARRLPKGAVKKLRSHARVQQSPVPEARPRQVPPPPPTKNRAQPLIWSLVGQERQMTYLSVEQVRGIHSLLVRDFAESADPIFPYGVSSEALLESAVSRPLTANGDTLKYPTMEMASGALLHGIVHDHPFHNGNKRTGLVSMLVMLDENRLTLEADQDVLFKLVLQLAQHRLVPIGSSDRADREVLHIAEWLRTHTRRVEGGERVIDWVRLRRILASHAVGITQPGPGKLNLSRDVWLTTGSLRKRRQRQELRTQVAYVDDGRDVPKKTVSKIRKDLWLDEQHGVDSHVFYNMEPAPPEDFILLYRKTLDRLAKL